MHHQTIKQPHLITLQKNTMSKKITTPTQKTLSLSKAKEVVQTLGIKSAKQYKARAGKAEFPTNLPRNPIDYYGKEWTSWAEFLGTGETTSVTETTETTETNIIAPVSESIENMVSETPNPVPTTEIIQTTAPVKGKGIGKVGRPAKTFLPYNEARAFVNTLKFQTIEEWLLYTQNKLRPDNIPSNPSIAYGAEFKANGGMRGWLGTPKTRRDLKGARLAAAAALAGAVTTEAETTSTFLLEIEATTEAETASAVEAENEMATAE